MNRKKLSVEGKGGKGGVLASGSCVVGGVKIPILEEDLVREVGKSNYWGFDGEEYVKWFGEKDEFLKKAMALLNCSPTLRSILKRKSRMVVGDGLVAQEKPNKTLLASKRKKRVNIDEDDSRVVELEEWICDVNKLGENILDILLKIVFDYFFIGVCFVELIKIEGDNEDESKFYVYHLPINKVRFKKKDEEDGLIKYVGVVDDWDCKGMNDNDVVDLPLYPVFEDVEGDERSVICVKNYSPGFEYYGLPDWIACFNWAEIEYRAPKYNISKFKNGYVPSSVVQFFGSVSKQEAEKIVKDFTDRFTDTGNNNKMFVQVLRDEKLKANVQKLDDNSDGNYLDLLKVAREEIIVGTGFTPSLAGVSESGKLGSNQQLVSDLEYVNGMEIKPVQNIFVSKVLNVILGEASEFLDSFKDVDVDIVSSMPVSFRGDIDVDKFIGINEGREVLGFEEASEGLLKEIIDYRTNGKKKDV